MSNEQLQLNVLAAEIDLDAVNTDLVSCRHQIAALRGKIGVMAELLEQSLSVLETLEGENAEEDALFAALKLQIVGALEVVQVQAK